MRKKTDFIRYSQNTLYWHSMNINLTLTPLFLILLQEKNCPSAFADNEGSYFYIMCCLVLNHAVQFIAMRKLMILIPHRQHTFSTTRAEAFGSVADNNDLNKSEDPNEFITKSIILEHQDENWDKCFNIDVWYWWVPSIIVEITCFVCFFCFTCDKFIYELWIPLDFILFCGMFAYYIITYREQKKIKEEEERMKEILVKRLER